MDSNLLTPIDASKACKMKVKTALKSIARMQFCEKFPACDSCKDDLA